MSEVKRNKISACRICNGKDFVPVIRLPQMPFTDEFLSAEKTGTEFLADVEIVVCTSCGSTQNSYNTDMSEYYNEYTYSVQSSGFANQFMQTLAKRVKKNYFPGKEKLNVIEIGSGTGEQLLAFKEEGFSVLGIEPSEQLSAYANRNGVKTLTAFFDENTVEIVDPVFKKADVVATSYTFDHIPRPVEVLQNIWNILNEDGILVVEVHDLELIDKRNEFCLFEHEHYTYLNQQTMTSLLNSNRFNVLTFDLLNQKEKRANSLLVVAQKSKEKISFDVDVSEQIGKLKNLDQEIHHSIERIDQWLLENKQSKIVAYGAGGRGVMTLAALKNYSMLLYMVDKNPKAQNIFAPKTHLPVYPIDMLGENKADLVLVFSFGYYDEIVKELGEKFGYHPDQFVSILELLEVQHG